MIKIIVFVVKLYIEPIILACTQSQDIQKTKDKAAMLVDKTKGDLKILLFNVHQHGCRDVGCKRRIG